jgi:hypothetical protein
MVDRSSRPHQQPSRTSQAMVRKLVHVRWKQRLGPIQIRDSVRHEDLLVGAVP